MTTQCTHLLFEQRGSGLIAGNRCTCNDFDLRAHPTRHAHAAQTRIAVAPHARLHAAQCHRDHRHLAAF